MKYIKKYRKILTLVFVIVCYIMLYYVSKDNFDKLKEIARNALDVNFVLLGATVFLVVPRLKKFR